MTQKARMFRFGESVRIRKKTHVVDRERKHEGPDPSTLPPIEQDLTGEEGNVCGGSYFSEQKGEMCVPVQLPNEALIGVPEDRLERAGPNAVQQDGGGQSKPSPLAPGTMSFWEKVFGRKRKNRSAD